MKRLGTSTRRLFTKWGRWGGQARARRLTPAHRANIAAHAARTRWGLADVAAPLRSSVRLRKPMWHDPVYLEEILAEGTVADWRALYQQITEHPFGPIAKALEQVLTASKIYGATPLWQGLLRRVQGTLS